jgi:hypothetical protein
MTKTRILNTRTPQLFVSYSRKDGQFVDLLVKSLQESRFAVFRDVEEILPTEEWRGRLKSLIGKADTIVFVLTPESAASEVCLWESNYAKQLNKRIVPIVARDLGEIKPPEALRELQYIFFTDDKTFHVSLHQLVRALNTNIDWIREHTRLGELARRWDDHGRYVSLLLWGEPLKQAEQWLSGQPDEAPEPDGVLRAYIKAGRKMAAWRKRIAIAAAFAGLILVLAVPAYFYPNQAYMAVMRWPALASAYRAPAGKIALSQSARSKAAATAGQLTQELRSSFLRLRSNNDATFTPWPVAQFSVVLGEREGLDDKFLSDYFKSRMDQKCNCWRETPEKEPHAGATSWVLYSMAAHSVEVPGEVVSSLLDLQDGKGWWPIYPARALDQNASSYATAWAIIALTELQGKINDKELANRIRVATGRAAAWLLDSRIASRTRWYDYPFGTKKIESISVSGLVLHSLHARLNAQDLTELDAKWIAELPAELGPASEFDLTDTYIILRNGALDFDRTRHYKLQWAMIATADAYANATLLERAKALAWFELMLKHEIVDEDVLKQNWVSSELVLALTRLRQQLL